MQHSNLQFGSIRSGSDLDAIDAIAQSVHLWTRCGDCQGIVRTGRQAFAGGMITGLCRRFGLDDRVRELSAYAYALLDDCGGQALPVTRLLLDAGDAGETASAWREGAREARAICVSLLDGGPKEEADVQYLGIDGCKAGWFFVSLEEGGSFDVGIVPVIEDLAPRLERCALALIDIPIGLPSGQTGERRAEVEARQRIAARASSVFPVPCRRAIQAADYRSACAVNEAVLGRRLPRQTWNIVTKIRDVDEFLSRRVLRHRLREMHPELAFWALNDRKVPAHGKKTPAGFTERLDILTRYCPQSMEVFRQARNRFPRRSDLADDDILDALAGAVTAIRYPGLDSVPAVPQFDERGLAMEMVFAAPDAGPGAGMETSPE